MMDAAQVLNALEQSPPMVEVPMPTNERQTRPLVGLTPADQQAVWTEAVAANAGRVPSGSQVARVVVQYHERKPEPSVARTVSVKSQERIDFDPAEPEELADRLAEAFDGECWRRLLVRLAEWDHKKTA
jgi:hypothetical protein